MGERAVTFPELDDPCRLLRARFGALVMIDTCVYTFAMRRATAKLFKNGGSQAVRLPKDCRFPDGATEVYARREGNVVVLELKDQWPAGFFDGLRGGETVKRPAQRRFSSWKNPFDRPGRRVQP